MVGVNGSSIDVEGVVSMDIVLGGQRLSADFVVVRSLSVQSLLGIDFLKRHRCVIDVPNKVMQCHGLKIPLETAGNREQDGPVCQAMVTLMENVTVPAWSEVEVLASTNSLCSGGTWLVEGLSNKNMPQVLVACAAVTPIKDRELGCIPVRMVNPSSVDVTIYRGMAVAVVERISDCHIAAAVHCPVNNTVSDVSPRKKEMLYNCVQSCEDLSEQEREEMLTLLLMYEDVLADKDEELGRTALVQHSIDTGDAPPIKQQVRSIPVARQHEVRKLLDEMLQKDVIQPSASPWASPVVLVQKKDGTLRFCVDYRKLNAVTRKDAYPLPRIDETLEALGGSKWFSTLDLLSGYWQVEMNEQDRSKTAFSTREGLFEFKVMPFGLCNAPATFQRLMDMVLAGVKWSRCLVYLDDIIVMGKSFHHHLLNLRVVIDKLREAGLKMKLSKCAFFRKEVLYLGHKISREGISTDPSKVDAVNKWPTPATVQELQKFLGLTGYYKRYVRNFASIAKPLHRLTEKGRDFKWTAECAEAFGRLKGLLVSAPILTFPDFNNSFILDTDASEYALGAVLSQEVEGCERVVAFASRVMNKAERKYSVTRKELLAVVTFTKHFRSYLLGRRFVLRTDHSALQWLYSFKEPEGQTARWLEMLQEFDFQVIHRRGRDHGNADALSRPNIQSGHAVPIASTSTLDSSVQQLQQSDEAIGPLYRAMCLGTKPDPGTQKGACRELVQLLEQWDQLVLKDAILYRQHEDANGYSHLQLIVPKVCRDDVLHKVHNAPSGGHLGEAKTLNRLQERFYWPGHVDAVKLWCKCCADCAARKNPGQRRRAPLQSVQAGYPMQIVAVDIVGPFSPVQTGNCYVLVVSDYFTKWMEAFAIPNQEAVTVAEKLVEEVFCRFSIPEQLHSDQGRQFEGKVMQEVCKLLRINKTRTTAYHPQSDGLVERLNRTLLHMLAATVHEYPGDWDKQLRVVCMAYNTSVHQSTGFSPFFLMFGRPARIPVDLEYGTAPMEETSPQEYGRNLRQRLEKAFSAVRIHTGAALERQKELYNRRVHGEEYQVGDLVWLHNPIIPKGAKRKLHCPWIGPYKVVKKLSTVVYRIQDTRPSRRKRLVVHFDRLKPCPSMGVAKPEGQDHPGDGGSPDGVEEQIPQQQEQRQDNAELIIVDDEEETLEIRPRNRGPMRQPMELRQQEIPEPLQHGDEATGRDVLRQQEIPEPLQHVDEQEATESDVQNEELPQPEAPPQEDVVRQHRYPRRHHQVPDYYGAVPYV